MSWWLRYVAASTALAAIDGAFLGGVAAIITSVGTIVLGVIAYRKGLRAAAVSALPAGNGLVAELRGERDYWRAQAEHWRERAERRGRRT